MVILSAPPRPLVSVLLPVRNAARTLPATLESLRRQSLRDWECVPVDDGSSDGSLEVARYWARSETRLRVFARQAQGLPAALQFGLRQCRGEYVARLDADDLAHRERLRLQAEMLASEPDLAAVGCQVRLFPRRALGNGYRAYELWLNGLLSPADIAREAFIECPIAHPALFARAPVLHRLGYRTCPWPEDYDLVLRLLGTGYQIGSVPRRLCLWRLHPGQTRHCHPRYSQGAIVRCKAHFLARGFLRSHSEYVLWGYGKTGRALRRALQACGKEARAIVEIHPGRLRHAPPPCWFIPPEHLHRFTEYPLVVSVAGAPARWQIRSFLASLPFEEGRNCVFAA